jgi:hypothetical protein
MTVSIGTYLGGVWATK